MAAAAVLFALLGPFGMTAMPLGERLVKWGLFALGGYLFFRPVVAGARALTIQTGWPQTVTLGVACIFASMPTTLLVAWILLPAKFAVVPLQALAGLYPQVLLVGMMVTALQVLLQQRRTAALNAPISAAPAPVPSDETDALPPAVAQAPRATPGRPANPLLDRLPPALGRDPLYVENEDHYIRVHTRNGNALLLMRLRDAAAALEDFDGLRVHRGWWVARGAVTGVVRRNRAISLTLFDGREAPISRAMIPELRAAGWLEKRDTELGDQTI